MPDDLRGDGTEDPWGGRIIVIVAASIFGLGMAAGYALCLLTI